MAAPKGNRNSSRDNRLWGDTIRRAAKEQDGKRLRAIADKLFDEAAAGNVIAMKEIGDRLDGKAHQTITADVDATVTVQVVQFGKKGA